MERISFVFYKSFAEALQELDPEEYKSVMIAITDYAFYGIEPELKGALNSIFVLIKPQIDANNKKFENGKKGGAPVGNSNASKPKPDENQKQPKTTKNNQKQRNDNDNDNDNVNDKDNVKDNDSLFFKADADAPEKQKEQREPFINAEVDGRFEKFKSMRSEKGKAMNADSEQIIKDKIVKFSKGDPVTAAKIIDQAIEGGYMTVIPLQQPPEPKARSGTGSEHGFAQHDYDFAELTRRAKA